MKVLVVDDSAMARRMIINVLKRAGMENVQQANDGQEALSYISTNEYQLILMDWNMPNMTGIEAVEKIREKDQTTPIIMVTGLGDEHHVKEAIKKGVNNFIIKPFLPDKAISIIKDTLKQFQTTNKAN